MSQSVFKRLLDRPPAGYHAGVTLNRTLGELSKAFRISAAGEASAFVEAAEDGILCRIRERVQRHFLMHLVGVELTMTVAAPAVPGAKITIRNTGMVFRSGISCKVSASHRNLLEALAASLARDGELSGALTRFDFRRCEILGTPEGWVVLIEPFGASEVVNRMPSFRRYLRLGSDQVAALVATLKALQRLLRSPCET